MLVKLTFANFWILERETGVLVEAQLAELALPAFGVVGAVVADAPAHISGGRVHGGIEVAGCSVLVAITF